MVFEGVPQSHLKLPVSVLVFIRVSPVWSDGGERFRKGCDLGNDISEMSLSSFFACDYVSHFL